MANDERLIFPVGFDLESAAKDVINDWPTYAKRIQKAIDSTPMMLRIIADDKHIGESTTRMASSIKSIEQKLPQLKLKVPDTVDFEQEIERLKVSLKDVDLGALTKEEQTDLYLYIRQLEAASKQLRELNKAKQLSDKSHKALREASAEQKRADALAKSALAEQRSAKIATERARQSEINTRNANNEAIAVERKRKATASAELAELRLANAQKKGAEATKAQNAEYHKQSSYISRLIQRLGIYTGIYAAAGMIRDIRETTAEFELQEVALGAIIQDAHQAAVLFSQIKAAAVESPYQIKELVNYTKQLAAYGFEQNTLFDTTMKLADISAGLGADMSRIILAVGQISAASVLKGTELRQLTELGIPMVELLAEKFTELRGEVVSTGEVFEMISDKAVSFKMVEEILNDLTSAGGMFYDMQKKQADTLAGQWSNLKDTIAIAYDEIGNTEQVRGAMEGWINAVKALAEEWRFVAGIVGRVAVSLAAVKVVSLFLPTQITNTRMLATATNNLAAAQERYNAAQGRGMAGISAKWAMNHARWMQKAATATTVFGRSMKQLAAFFAGGGWLTLAVTAITVLVSWFVTARQEANRLNNELAKIGSEGATKMEQSVRNFERLAKIAVESVDGTKEQTEALKELQRTYGDIIPAQDLSIEKLREMKGSYDAVTQAIREKIAMQTLEQKISTIQEDYGSDIAKQQKKFKKYLEETAGLSSEEAIRVIANIQRQIADGAVTGVIDGLDALDKALGEEVLDPIPYDVWTDIYDGFGMIQKSFKKFIDLSVGMKNAIKSVTSEMESETGVLGKYTDAWKKANSDLATDIGNITVSKNTKLYEEEVEKAKINNYTDFLKNTIGSEIKDFDIKQYIQDGIIDFESLFNLEGISVQARNAVRQVQNEMKGLEGWKKTVQDFSRDVTIGGIPRKLSLYTDEEVGNFSNLKDALEDVAKKWKDYDAEVTRYTSTLKGKLNPEEKKYTENKKEQSSELKRQAYEILKYYNALDLIEKQGKGKGQDEWIILMKNRASFMKDFQQGVENLSKKMKEQDALFKEQGIMASRGISVGYDVSSLKGTPEELSKWYEDAIKEVTKKIKSVGGNEGFAELSISAILKKDTKNQLIKSYQELLQWLFNQKTDFETKQLEENLKKEIDRLATAVSRSKEAKDFYDKMLGMTGDKQLSADLTMSVYGGVGDDLKENIKRQLTDAFKGVDISSAFSGDNVDYKKLEALIPQLPEDLQDNARKLVNEGIKDNARWLQDLYKTYEEFKTYEQRRTTVMEREAQKRREIEANTSLTTEQKETQIAASKKREAQQLDTIDLEEFKASEDWIQTFENIDKVGTKSIQHLMVVLKKFIETNKDLTPEQIKTLMTEYEKLYQGLIARNPLKAITEGTKEYFVALKELRKAKKDEGLKEAKEEEKTAEKEVKTARQDVKQAKTEEDRSAATLRLSQAEERLAKAQDKRAKAENKVRKAQDKQRTALNKVENGVTEAAVAYNALNDVVSGVMETFNIDETSELGIVLKSVAQALTMVAGVLGVINAMITLIETHPLVLAISAGIMAIIGAIMLFQNLKTANSERIIKEQEKLLEQLEYQYKKLEKAAESAFGTEYLDNYAERLENLYLTQSAYEKQAQAERDKGKQADEDAIKDYDESARDTADEILEMQKEVSEKMLGSDLGSAARDFADAWIEAYKSFGNTADAIGEKFSEMIDNMVAESVIAGVMKTALKPIFDLIDGMTADDLYDPKFWQNLGTAVETATEDADVGATNAMRMLEAMGINIREMGEGLTGISKDIATASEESILGLSAGINTQNFYISQIHAAVLRMEMLMQNGAGGGVNIQDLVTIQNQHLAYLPNIADNTANTLAECRSILGKVTDIADNLDRVISATGTPSTHHLHTTLS